MNNAETIFAEEIPEESVSLILAFFKGVGIHKTLSHTCDSKDFYSDVIRGQFLEITLVERGKISCILSVKSSVTNAFGGLHGGAVAAVAEMVAVACARTVVGKDKEIFLGELSNSYLSAAPHNSEVVVEGSVIRSGRNLTVVGIEFKSKENMKLLYLSRATFYNSQISSL
jgi:acyl-coenzyme A thioesterase 13